MYERITRSEFENRKNNSDKTINDAVNRDLGRLKSSSNRFIQNKVVQASLAFLIIAVANFSLAYMPETQPLTLEDIPTESEGYFNLVHNPKIDVYMTSYNPEVGQTDSTPCIAGGTGYNVCHMAQNGQRPIALSQELIKWSVSVRSIENAFSKGDEVMMVSDNPDPRCNGKFIVADAMNVRYRNRGDLFFMSRKDNINCQATIQLIS